MAATVMIIMCLIGTVSSFPNGAPIQACTTLQPEHGDTKPMDGENPFVLTISGTEVKQGETLTVSLSVAAGGEYGHYGGFFLVAVKKGTTDRVGKFQLPESEANWKIGACEDEGGAPDFSAVTHNSEAHKTTNSFTWTAPSDHTGEFCMRGAVAHNKANWYLYEGTSSEHCFTVGADEEGAPGEEAPEDPEGGEEGPEAPEGGEDPEAKPEAKGEEDHAGHEGHDMKDEDDKKDNDGKKDDGGKGSASLLSVSSLMVSVAVIFSLF